MPVPRLLLATLSSVLAAASFAADVAYSPPVGGMTITIAAGTGTTRATSTFSAPLWMESSISGASTGRISSLTASTITVSGANWTASALSNASVPHFIQITSGTAAGRTLLISTVTANTSDTLSIDSTESDDLTTLGISTGSSGDTFKIFAADTLSLLLPGDSGVLTGSSAAASDIVYLNIGGSWRSYFYSSTNSRWQQITLGSPNASNVPLAPQGAVQYSRLAATPLTLTITGTVPSTSRQVRIANNGVSFVSSGWPVATTLQSSGFQNIAGWRSSSSASSADIVQLFVSGAWRKYFYDGTNRRQVTLGSPISNSQTVPAGSAYLVIRAAGSGSSVLTQAAPYTL